MNCRGSAASFHGERLAACWGGLMPLLARNRSYRPQAPGNCLPWAREKRERPVIRGCAFSRVRVPQFLCLETLVIGIFLHSRFFGFWALGSCMAIRWFEFVFIRADSI
jgi:hypothetical protein